MPFGSKVSADGLAGASRRGQVKLGEALQAKWLKVMEGCSKNEVSEFSPGARNSPPDPPDPPDRPEVVAASAPQTLPSHEPGARMTVV